MKAIAIIVKWALMLTVKQDTVKTSEIVCCKLVRVLAQVVGSLYLCERSTWVNRHCLVQPAQKTHTFECPHTRERHTEPMRCCAARPARAARRRPP